MATITKSRLMQVSSATGGGVTARTYPEGASQTFVKGELVLGYFGYVTEIAGDTPTAILGMAAQDAHNTTAGAANVSVVLAAEGTIFSGNMLSTSLADRTSGATDIVRPAGISRDTTNSLTFVNGSVTGGSSARVWVHGFARGSAAGDVNARVLFEFLPTFVQNRSTS